MALTLLAAALAAGCASSKPAAEPPAWFVERSRALNREGFPRLANVPDHVDANTNQEYWDNVRKELDAEGAAVRASPRSEAPPAPEAQAAAADEFDARARAELEATRQKH
jgi:hypothetical protein